MLGLNLRCAPQASSADSAHGYGYPLTHAGALAHLWTWATVAASMLFGFVALRVALQPFWWPAGRASVHAHEGEWPLWGGPLAMGADGHSRLCTLIVGRTTSDMIRSAEFPSFCSADAQLPVITCIRARHAGALTNRIYCIHTIDTVIGTAMLLHISQRSGLTLQEQIVSQLRARILSGDLEADAPLPSIRALAQSLKVGINTVQRAYEHLLADDLIYARQGKGFFVAELDTQAKSERARTRFREALAKLIDEAKDEGLSEDELGSIFAARLAANSPGDKL